LIEAITTRMTPHSSDDDDTYRSKEERDAFKTSDCNLKFKNELLDLGIIDEDWLNDDMYHHHQKNEESFE
jgi:2-oxoisovalerate dehydrogenase E1 component alpha subunit